MANEEKKPVVSQAKGNAVKRSNEKPRLTERVKKWFREMRSELKKVVYPSAKQVRNNTLLVLLCVLIVGIFVWVFDGVATFIIQGLISLVKGG